MTDAMMRRGYPVDKVEFLLCNGVEDVIAFLVAVARTSAGRAVVVVVIVVSVCV